MSFFYSTWVKYTIGKVRNEGTQENEFTDGFVWTAS